MAQWRAAVGLEIHAQILSKSKIFSRGSTKKCESSNSGIHFLDIGLPGALPILNKRCVEAAIQTATALSATVNLVSYFDRKHYFYPDLPNGYQITQKRKPIAEGGHLEVPLLPQYRTSLPTVSSMDTCEVLDIAIQRIQLEHDSGKTTYEDYKDGSTATVVDFSRSGCGLMEIVTAPVMSSGADAASFVRELQLLLRTIKTCDGNMEDGSLRVDANVSVAPVDSNSLGTRSEVKNISGIRFLAKAIDHEIKRHIQVLKSGEAIEEETRFFDEQRGVTVPSRSKEVEHDYRFLPEADLPPLRLSNTLEQFNEFTVSVPMATRNLPEIPMVIRRGLMKEHGLNLVQTSLLVDKQAVDYYKAACKSTTGLKSSQEVYKWLTGDLFALSQDKGKNVSFLEASPVTPQQLASIVQLILSESLTRAAGQKILRVMASGDERLANEIARSMALLVPPTDIERLKELCERIVQEYPKEVERLKRGKVSLLGFLTGQVMKSSGSQLKPQDVKSELVQILKLQSTENRK